VKKRRKPFRKARAARKSDKPPTLDPATEMVRRFFAWPMLIGEQGQSWGEPSEDDVPPGTIRVLRIPDSPEPVAKPKGGRQQRRVRGVLPKLYPDGVPDHVPTETVLQNVINEIQKTEPAYKVSWRTVNRVLGRDQRDQ
jgi:hypothetical protein